MSEETKDAATVVPKAMVTAYLINGAMTFVMLVTYCFTLTDYTAATDSAAGVLGVPWIQVFITATASAPGGTALLAVLLLIMTCCLTNWMASAARQVFAFARDRGLPFGAWLARVDAAGTCPLHSLVVVGAAAALLPLITLGSTVAFDALVSLQILALMFTYLVSHSCILWRWLRGAPLPERPWSLGRAGGWVNAVGWLYCFYQVVFIPWPVVMPVTVANFNWASVMFCGIMTLSLVYYAVWARKVYDGPVKYVRKEGMDGEHDGGRI